MSTQWHLRLLASTLGHQIHLPHRGLRYFLITWPQLLIGWDNSRHFISQSKAKTNYDLLTCVFPRLFTGGNWHCCDWSKWLLELWYSVVSSSALLPVSEEVRSNLRPGNPKEPDSSTPPYPGKLENSSMAGSATSLDSQVSIVITTASSSSPNDDPNDHRFVWPTECQNTLLNPGIVNDTQTQALLLTTLVMWKKRHCNAFSELTFSSR